MEIISLGRTAEGSTEASGAKPGVINFLYLVLEYKAILEVLKMSNVYESFSFIPFCPCGYVYRRKFKWGKIIFEEDVERRCESPLIFDVEKERKVPSKFVVTMRLLIEEDKRKRFLSKAIRHGFKISMNPSVGNCHKGPVVKAQTTEELVS